jgi:hypothetical protein
MQRFTPCDHPGDAINYSSIESCASRCLSSCDTSSDCTTAVIKTKMGDGRACNDGKLGLDDVGGCVPAFGDLKDAWDYFDGNCTACSDSDACWSACNTITSKAPAVVDAGKTHPSVCPSFDCPDCVGPCGKCDSSSCMSWCNDFYDPKVHCSGDTVKSVQGTFTDYSLETRTTDVDKALGTFYDAKCKNVSIQRTQQYYDAFGSDRYRTNLRTRYNAQSRQEYVDRRVREAEQRRAQQLASMGISGTLRSSSSTSRFRPATQFRQTGGRANATEMATCRNGFGQVMRATDNGQCDIVDDPVSVGSKSSGTPTVFTLLKRLFAKLGGTKPETVAKPESTKLTVRTGHRNAAEGEAEEEVVVFGRKPVRLTEKQARVANAARRKHIIDEVLRPKNTRNTRSRQTTRMCRVTTQGATMCKFK